MVKKTNIKFTNCKQIFPIGKQILIRQSTLDVLEQLFFWDINFLQGLAHLLLPQSNKLIESVNIVGRHNEEGLVQGSWIIYSFYSVGCNVIFLVENRCQQTYAQTLRNARHIVLNVFI